MSLDSLCTCQVQVSIYCARRIPLHLRCTQCSIMLHIIDICFLSCICLWQISQIQTCLCVVGGPGFVWTLTAFMSSSARHPSGPHDCLSQKNIISGTHFCGWKVSTQFVQQVAKTAVTAPPHVGCVAWSLGVFFTFL